ncbi:MAG: class I SAM-dependent methyltransferase [Candidatus Omnitrophica bacterium]|nr:hypothetical protein [bacterium]NUN97953.1 class I SAM-dependent methyltransferase [Candidatus Omnitrophota bacterium]
MERRRHWENIYTTKQPDQVSWHQSSPRVSLDLIGRMGLGCEAQVIDVGGGASTLVDALLGRGFSRMTVLDISAAALDCSRKRLGPLGERVTWVQGDITDVSLPKGGFDLWHDRAVFHFLTDPADRRKYVKVLKDSVCPGGHVLISTFATDGPLRCSGLEVVRYSPESLWSELGSEVELVETEWEAHQTPFGTTQSFVYCHFRRK